MKDNISSHSLNFNHTRGVLSWHWSRQSILITWFRRIAGAGDQGQSLLLSLQHSYQISLWFQKYPIPMLNCCWSEPIRPCFLTPPSQFSESQHQCSPAWNVTLWTVPCFSWLQSFLRPPVNNQKSLLILLQRREKAKLPKKSSWSTDLVFDQCLPDHHHHDHCHVNQNKTLKQQGYKKHHGPIFCIIIFCYKKGRKIKQLHEKLSEVNDTYHDPQLQNLIKLPGWRSTHVHALAMLPAYCPPCQLEKISETSCSEFLK